MHIEPLAQGIWRLLIPFEDLTTTVYIVEGEGGAAVIDSGTYPSDAEAYIVPALAQLGIARESVRYLLLTHDHLDHSGGMARLHELLPEAVTTARNSSVEAVQAELHDGDVLLGRLQAVALPGHADNATAYLDTRTNTLLSGDCLQLRGIGKYRNGIQNPAKYADSVRRLMGLRIDRIVAAHEYDPLGSIAEGAEAVAEYLALCLDICREMQ